MKRLSLLITVLLIASCNKPNKPTFKTVKNLKVVSSTINNVVVEGTVVLNNPNPYAVKVKDAFIGASANDVKVTSVKQMLSTEIAAYSDFEFPLSVSFNPRETVNTDNIGGVLNVLKNRKVDMFFKGYVVVELVGKDTKIPLEFQKELSLKKKKEVSN